MLSVVPIAIASSTRQVVLRHPNSMACTVFQKVVKRVEQDPETGQPEEMGGMATMGGMGVLRSEDEADYDYVLRGEAKCLFAGVFVPNDINERDDAVLAQPAQEAQVEPLVAPDSPDYFITDTTDLVLITPGLGVVLAYEVGSISGQTNIPPYVRKLVLNPKDDLHNLEPFIPEATSP